MRRVQIKPRLILMIWRACFANRHPLKNKKRHLVTLWGAAKLRMTNETRNKKMR